VQSHRRGLQADCGPSVGNEGVACFSPQPRRNRNKLSACAFLRVIRGSARGNSLCGGGRRPKRSAAPCWRFGIRLLWAAFRASSL